MPNVNRGHIVNRRLLSDTVDKVRRNLQATREGLGMLLHAHAGTDSDQQRQTPLVTPVACAQAVARKLSDNVYQPVLSIDPRLTRPPSRPSGR